MGQEIATACAGPGLDVLIADRSVDIAAQALQEIAQVSVPHARDHRRAVRDAQEEKRR
jgi:3-hydroxyacyl-CoA dehydrogenase